MENYSLSDVAAVTDRRGYGDGFFGGEGGFFWIFALLILPMLWGGNNGLWGNNGRGEPVTEAGLCNAMNFNNLENAVGRLGDTQQQQFTQLTNGVCNLGYEQLRNIAQLSAQSANETNETQRQLASCCCDIERGIDSINYNGAINTASINANTTAQVQKVLDVLCQDKISALQNQVNCLQLQQAVAGVVRYPTTFSYNAGASPFCGGGYNYGCGNGNI